MRIIGVALFCQFILLENSNLLRSPLLQFNLNFIFAKVDVLNKKKYINK